VVYQVRVAETEQAFEVAADETILAAARRANVKLAHDCELGRCGLARAQGLCTARRRRRF
jgi:CDP-4-dehydro-6-deoxyglucose reductase